MRAQRKEILMRASGIPMRNVDTTGIRLRNHVWQYELAPMFICAAHSIARCFESVLRAGASNRWFKQMLQTGASTYCDTRHPDPYPYSEV